VEEEQELMTKDDVLFGYRLQLFAEAARSGNVSVACRMFGVHRSAHLSSPQPSGAPGDSPP
ncbi:MAG: hypothetical protein M3N47_07830, partial [Chloroflexota bacterium]|nr:hypothetical protein [Chloroflexota bacterium]